MIIIGEKINGSIPSVKQAIERRDSEFVHNLAIRQADAGADYLDVCAGTAPDVEAETLIWLMDVVQKAVDTPLCIDGPNATTILQVLPHAKHCGLINSVSGEGKKCEILFPMIRETGWQVIALTCDDNGIPSDVETRVDIAKTLIEKAKVYGINPERVHIDPLVLALPADNQSLLKFVQTLKAVKSLYPTVKVTSGLSNISFGMPLRKVVNQHFLALAMYEGMDSAIIDPCNRDILTTLLTTEALLGRDRFCRNFSNAYRNKKIGPISSSS
ncbi:5-methyltetrahydrofolate:corrinoid/iron-sulfur protein co-methyltransferase [Peptococcaceae bacterium CEB3]|nr:5-methyltetrahydrofolate:corrinoid/iron-sulfur protein co-methyltransferase [Peptococcaceae bacterium CEB3]